MVLYALGRGLSEPAFVLKIPYDPTASGRLKRAFDHLTELTVRLDGSPLSGSVPRPIFFGEVEGHPVLVESFLRGRSLMSLPGDRARLRGCLRVFAWLAQFGLHTVQKVRAEEIQRRGLVIPDDIIAELDMPGPLREFAEHVQEEMLRGDEPLPLVFVHNDLIPRNVLLSDGHVGLLDWEFSERQGLPLLDGIDFAVNMIRMVRGEDLWPAFRRLVLSGDSLARQMRCEVRKLGAALGVKRQWIEGLLVGYLLRVLSTTTAYGDDVLQAVSMLSAGGLTGALDELAPVPNY
jgi:hypothetical protein